MQRHEYEQKPIKIYDDIEFKSDVVDTKVKKNKQKTDSTDGNFSSENTSKNKENIMPYPPESPVTYKYALTMCSIPEFDKKYFFPKVAKKIKVQEKKAQERSQQKKQLLEKLKVNTEKMEKNKKCK